MHRSTHHSTTNAFASNFPFSSLTQSDPLMIPCSVDTDDWFDDKATNRSVILNSDQDDDDWLILTNDDSCHFQQHPKRVSLDSRDSLMWMDDRCSMDLDDLSFLDDDDEEMNADEHTYLQWCEHRNRLSLCMQKTQETRTTLAKIKELTKAFTQTQESMCAVQEKVLTETAAGTS